MGNVSFQWKGPCDGTIQASSGPPLPPSLSSKFIIIYSTKTPPLQHTTMTEMMEQRKSAMVMGTADEKSLLLNEGAQRNQT